MPDEKQNLASCLTSVRSVFGDLQSTQSDFENFFSDMFDQLESMSLELFARHKCLELGTQHRAEQDSASQEHERQFRECLEALRSLEANVRSAHEEVERAWSEISATHQQFLREHVELRETQEEIRRISAECRAMREGVEHDRAESRQLQENIQEHLQRLANVVTELATTKTTAGSNEQVAQVLEETRRQEAAWKHDRAELESQLQAERQRATQQSETFAEQRRLAAQQQGELAGELKRMRSLMELMTNHMNPPSSAHAGGPTSVPSENDALASMLAQFEMLQRDLAQRRAGRPKSATKT